MSPGRRRTATHSPHRSVCAVRPRPRHHVLTPYPTHTLTNIISHVPSRACAPCRLRRLSPLPAYRDGVLAILPCRYAQHAPRTYDRQHQVHAQRLHRRSLDNLRFSSDAGQPRVFCHSASVQSRMRQIIHASFAAVNFEDHDQGRQNTIRDSYPQASHSVEAIPAAPR